jgi:GTP cyclohydrolase III
MTLLDHTWELRAGIGEKDKAEKSLAAHKSALTTNRDNEVIASCIYF